MVVWGRKGVAYEDARARAPSRTYILRISIARGGGFSLRKRLSLHNDIFCTALSCAPVSSTTFDCATFPVQHLLYSISCTIFPVQHFTVKHFQYCISCRFYCTTVFNPALFCKYALLATDIRMSTWSSGVERGSRTEDARARGRHLAHTYCVLVRREVEAFLAKN